MRCRILVLSGLLACLASASQAQNLVTNWDFETGDTTGWTVAGDNCTVVAGDGIDGSYAISCGAHSPDVDDISQMLATQPGQQYMLTLFARTPEFFINPPGSPNSLTVYFDGNMIDGPFTVPDDPGYQQYTYMVTATSTATMLRFTVSNDPDYTQIDNISMTKFTLVPEPGSLSLLAGACLSGAGFLSRRRKQGR